MKSSRKSILIIPAFIVSSILFTFALLVGWSWMRCPNNIVTNTNFFSHSLKVTNGVAYEKATVELSNYERAIFPLGTLIKKSSDPGSNTLTILMEKQLSFGGHPPHPINICDAVNYFGLASSAESDSIKFGTYGEWKSKEGGAWIRMIVVAPENFDVVTKDLLSGEESQAAVRNVDRLFHLQDSETFEQCYWYAVNEPADVWTPIKTSNDVDTRSLAEMFGDMN